MIRIKIFKTAFTLITLIIFSCVNQEAARQDITLSPPYNSTIGDTAANNPNTTKEANRNISSEYTIHTTPSGNGWGYSIFNDNILIIDQPHIPAVNGIIYFATQKDAQKTGELMISKLKKKIMPPTVSLFELDSMDIKY